LKNNIRASPPAGGQAVAFYSGFILLVLISIHLRAYYL